MTELPAYMTGLIATALIVALTAWAHSPARSQLLRTALVIIANWFAGVIYVHNTGNTTPWQFSLFIDSAAAFAVMFHPAGRAQGYIGAFYCFQIAGHVAYGGRHLEGLPADPVFYYDAITYVAWAQLFALGAWCGGIWLGDVLPWVRGSGHALDRGKGAHDHREIS